ncbi:hypothetical protein BH20ACT2_BH20ACT2_14610 [soil metagenome]
MRRRAALAVAIVVLLAGCGLSEDGAPRRIAAEAVPSDLLAPATSTTTTTPSSPTAEITLHFVRGERLYPLVVELETPLTPSRVLSAVLNGPPSTAPDDVSSTAPPGLRLLDAEPPRDGLLTVGLSAEVDNIASAAQKTLFAQLTCTATRLEGVNLVRFRVTDEIRRVSIDGDTAEVVNCSDYLSLRQP